MPVAGFVDRKRFRIARIIEISESGSDSSEPAYSATIGTDDSLPDTPVLYLRQHFLFQLRLHRCPAQNTALNLVKLPIQLKSVFDESQSYGS